MPDVPDSVREEYSGALDMMAGNRMEEAEASMRKVLKDCDFFYEAYEGLAMVLHYQGKLDEAIDLMKELAQKDPDNVMAHSNLSVFFMKKGMIEEAEEEKAKATVLKFSQGESKGG